MKADELNPQRFVLDPKSSSDLRSKLKQDPQAGLRQAAQQFEGMLLQMMLKSMRDATPQDGLLDSDQSRFFTSIMDQQLAQTLSSQGKLGFAKLIEQQLSRNQATQTPGAMNTSASLDVLQKALLTQQAASLAGAASAPGAERSERVRAPVDTASGAAAAPHNTPTGNQDFVSRIWSHAVEAGNATGIPAHFVVAHAALESAWGKSELRSTNGAPTYNLFGVKAGRNWQGPTVEVQTTEYVNGIAQSSREKFRVYGSYAESFRDYASLLRNNSRFSGVLGQQDGTQFARSLQQSGYATDPMYADKLGRIINGGTLRQALLG
jgi:flagellar protein FlgJ